MAIDEEFIIERQGKRMVLYAGLLAEAHSKGLESIDTELLQVPTDQNGGVAIVAAVVYMEGGQHFSGIGDASPLNVARNIAPHIIRMAETRAKARALRDAINVAEALADDPVDSEASGTQAEAEAEASEASGTASLGKDRRTTKIKNLERLLEVDATQRDVPVAARRAEMESYLEKPLADLSDSEAAVWTQRLRTAIEKRRKEAEASERR